jgi:class 3 adenylate cyclase/Tfp pilus assembly protein PilF
MFSKGKVYQFLMGLFYFIFFLGSAQDQRKSDSLFNIFKADTIQGQAKLELLADLAFNEVNDLNLALKYADELILLAKQKGDYPYLSQGYFQKGNKKVQLGDLEEALESFFKCAEVARKNNRIQMEGSAYGAIAGIYSVSDNHKSAMLYFRKAITILRKAKDTIPLASFIMNAGDDFLTNKEYDSALVYFKESGALFEKSNYLIGKAYNLGNIGMVYANQGQNSLAEKNINEAVKILEGFEDYYPISVYLLSLSDIYSEKGDQEAALDYAQRSLVLGEKHRLKEQISDANLKLSELYEKTGNSSASLKHYKDFIVYRDSLNNIKAVQSMADIRTNHEVSQKQVEVDLLNQQKRNQLIILGFTGVLLLTLFWYYRTISREKKRSDALLLNILPSEIAKELKLKGKVEAVNCNSVTVLFTDFVQFSKIAEHIEPEQLVKSIDHYFKKFDEITSKYGIEKIKTIGDSYMCVAGLPTPNATHASNAIKAAKEMIEMVKTQMTSQSGLTNFEVRVGLHSGPVVAGIVGIKKWQYDIWGDTVNIASRMESNSEPGKINISETTYEEIKDEFPCEYRGEIEVKNRGMLKMYFLS